MSSGWARLKECSVPGQPLECVFLRRGERGVVYSIGALRDVGPGVHPLDALVCAVRIVLP